MPQTIILILATILLIPGIIMSVIPAIPGMIYMLVIALLYGFYDNFMHLTWTDIGILAIVAVITMLVDFFAGIAGAKWGGAHWTSIISGIVGLVLGSLFIPIPFIGSIIGMFLGVLVSEWYRTRDSRLANKAATGSLVGTLVGTGFKLVASIVFLILFVVLVVI